MSSKIIVVSWWCVFESFSEKLRQMTKFLITSRLNGEKWFSKKKKTLKGLIGKIKKTPEMCTGVIFHFQYKKIYK